MAKNLKLKIKNEQIAAAVNLGGLKDKLAKKKADKESTSDKAAPEAKAKAPKKAETKASKKAEPKTAKKAEAQAEAVVEAPPARRVKARSRSAFAPQDQDQEQQQQEEPVEEQVVVQEEVAVEVPVVEEAPEPEAVAPEEPPAEEPVVEVGEVAEEPAPAEPTPPAPVAESTPAPVKRTPVERLGPTGRHVRDLIPPKPKPKPAPAAGTKAPAAKKPAQQTTTQGQSDQDSRAPKKGGAKTGKFKEYRDVKPGRKLEGPGAFDSRARQGLRVGEEQHWRRRRHRGGRGAAEAVPVVRPSELTVRLPITLKDLASEMKLKASQLLEKLFLQDVAITINEYLDDATMVELLGHEFDCKITIDTAEEERIRITDKSIREEISEAPEDERELRPPIVAFMGHVDHGKTSLIDTIRKSNIAAAEAGAITQHIGAFRCHTAIGDLTIVDTPGHEAFSAMRARGADITDIVVLVVAGDEGIRAQTEEAIQHAKAAGVTIVVAINKSDKPNFDAENVYRQLSEQELLPEAWGGQTITVNCSAVTGEGINTLLEMLALQAEVLELRAHPQSRARGSVIESEMHKGLGATTSVLVQNGTLRHGDAIVFEHYWGRVKTMRNDVGKELKEASPSTPVEITGLSGLPEAGEEFIAVSNEKEAREIAEARMAEHRLTRMQSSRPLSVDTLFQEADEGDKKILNIVLRADVRGSLEALKVALEKIESDKADINIIFSGVGEVAESDIQLAAASGAMVLGFHTQVESHAESLVKQLGVEVRLHDIIYHAVDDIKDLMSGMLDKLALEEDRGKATVQATFKSSQLGVIAGCLVNEGTISRNHKIRLIRDGEQVWKGSIASIKRLQDDVREVQKGFECGIVLDGFNTVQENDILEAYEIVYITQEL